MNKTTLNSQKEKHSTLSLRRATRYAVNQFPVTLISIHALLAESDSYKRRSNFFNQHFYPRSPCGERPGHRYPVSSCIFISIHALLAESDFRIFAYGRRITRISIHALLAESDGGPIMQLYIGTKFLSTLSLRRATPVESRSNILITSVSIHALLAESDRYSLRHSTPSGRFYPRSPCGERRVTSSTVIVILRVSIHALLAESDDPA